MELCPLSLPLRWGRLAAAWVELEMVVDSVLSEVLYFEECETQVYL